MRGMCSRRVKRGQKTDRPETTKLSNFCEGAVLYGAAPGVEKTELFYIYQRVKNKIFHFYL